jgi:glycosyltransferase involved in cell wall biosynthesis
MDSSMLVSGKHSDDGTIAEVPRQDDFATRLGELARRHYIDLHRTPDWNTYFSLAWPGVDLAEHPLVREADIIHLHWLWDFQSVATLGRLMNLGKPVVWSFHDQRAMTGGCHYSAGCAGYEAGCASCPQLTADPAGLTAAAFADQKQAWRRDAVTVIGLSRWMAECARRSGIWCDSRIEVIPNSVETEVFVSCGKAECRRRMGLPEDVRCVLFGADFGEEIRKGFRGLMRAVTRCLDDPWFAGELRDGRIRFMCFGNPDPEVARGPVPIHALGYLKDDADLAAAYGAADFFVLPSLEDNLPNTVLESMSCGTPVLALDVGGVRDMVIEGHTGWLIPPGDDRLFADALLRALREPDIAAGMADACRERVVNGFSPALQAGRFAALYSDLLRHPPAVESAIGIADPDVPAEIDMGPQSRLAMTGVFKSAVAGLAEEPLDKTAHKRGYYRFRSAINGDLENVGTYPELLITLEHAFRKRSGKSSRSEWRCMKLKAWLRDVFRKTARP